MTRSVDVLIDPGCQPPRKMESSTKLLQQYQSIRRLSEQIAAPLSPEDCVVQSMPDASPTRWHLAHTTWFFETFFLKDQTEYQAFDPAFEPLFNSYYNAVGQPFPRDRRGHISRPGLSEIREYRRAVDDAMIERLRAGGLSSKESAVVQLGLQHEQQHQELMLTDIKHAFFVNPLRPAYQSDATSPPVNPCSQLRWHSVKASIAEVGGNEDASRFVYDNETPRHRTYIQQHEIATRCITNGEYLRFIEDRGYARPDFWLSLGWSHVMNEGWTAPLYWVRSGTQWQQFTLAGLTPLKLDEPVCHVSYFEADAFARWAGHRLPTEFEWEVTAATSPIAGIFADELFESKQAVHPQVDCHEGDSFSGLFGNLWEWTSSHYSPYPGYRAVPGALGEYNGKFMCNQFVLRGGSCATSKNHIRASYRNFFPPEARWQFSGIRLARGW